MEWVLVLYIYAGMMAQGDSVALTTVPMESEKACRVAGEAAKGLVAGTTKNTRYVCVRNKQ
jgi:hypothetical protein